MGITLQSSVHESYNVQYARIWNAPIRKVIEKNYGMLVVLHTAANMELLQSVMFESQPTSLWANTIIKKNIA